MQNIVLEEPYEFVPPVESDFWCWLLRFRLKSYIRGQFNLHSFECRGVEKLKKSIADGASIVLAANHSRLSDPVAMGVLSGEAGCELFVMASWHLFKEGLQQRFLIRRMGAFSVYREGNDRASVSQAIDILTHGRRPLLIFPEGAVSRHCDLMMELMDGPGFIARQAAKKRQKEGLGPVVVHPVAIRYSFDGDAAKTIRPAVDEMEKSFSWQPQSHLPIHKRLGMIGEALLSLKEVEYLGQAQQGDPHERADQLIVTVLQQLEEKWGVSPKERELLGEKPRHTDSREDEQRAAKVVSRVKRIRTVVLPDLIEKKVTPEEREERWRDLAACYYLQQIAHYPRGYLTGDNDLPERVLETFERMREDYEDKMHYYGPLHCTIVVDDPIEVSPQRDRKAQGDPTMDRVGVRLQEILDELVAERRKKLFGEA